MKRQLWELSINELHDELAVAQAVITGGNKSKAAADRLSVIQEQIEEREIENTYGGDAA